ncbi:MAG: erythromycin esterase family protein [Crocinitomicaceae bacterium]
MKQLISASFLTLLLLNVSFSFGQNFLKKSKKYIHPFSEINSEVLTNHIDKIADSARIIGLGEVSHYTRECYELKQQIIHKLIDKGYDALVLEVDFGQALLWNDYVVNGVGNIDSIIAQSGWFTYRTQEFKDLLISIREHNKTADKPFQVYGMEMTAINYNLEWLADYLDGTENAEDLIDQLNQERKTVAFQQHSPDEVLSYWTLFYDLKKYLDQHTELLIEQKGDRSYQIAMQMTEITRQYATYISQDDFLLKVEFRDHFSTRNVLWALDYLAEDSQIVIWAHNGHIAKESALFYYEVLGSYLSDWFGDQYYSIGFTFNEGDFGAFGLDGFSKFTLPPVTESSITKDFDGFNSNYLFFDIRRNLNRKKARNKPPFIANVPIRMDISESYNRPEGDNPMMEIDLSHSYDCLIYIDRTNYPTTIEWDN